MVANVLIGVTVVEQVRIARDGNPVMRRCLRGDTRGALQAAAPVNIQGAGRLGEGAPEALMAGGVRK